MRYLLVIVELLFAVNSAFSQGIDYKKEADAWKAPGWMLVHFTDAPNCPPCVRLEHEILTDRRVIKATGAFNCVLMCWCDPSLHPRIRQYKIRSFPTVMLIPPNRKDQKSVKVLEGCPKSADDFLVFLAQSENRKIGLPSDAQSQRNLIPTLAVTKSPQTQRVVEGRHPGGVTLRAADQTAPSTPFGSGARYSGMLTYRRGCCR